MKLTHKNYFFKNKKKSKAHLKLDNFVSTIGTQIGGAVANISIFQYMCYFLTVYE